MLPLTTVDQVHPKQEEPAKRKRQSRGLEGKTDTLTFNDIKFTFLSKILYSSLSNLGGYKSKKDTYLSFHFLSLYKPNKWKQSNSSFLISKQTSEKCFLFLSFFLFHFFSLPSVAIKLSVTNELGIFVRSLNPWLISHVSTEYKNSKIEMYLIRLVYKRFFP